MSGKLGGLEGSFLESWEGWDEIESGTLQFYSPVFRRDVGLPLEVIEEAERSAGVFVMDTSDSSIAIYYGDDSDKTYEHKVKLTLGMHDA